MEQPSVQLFDTHAHLSDAAFDIDRDALTAALPSRGISRVMDIACDVRLVQATLDLMERFPFVYGAVGMHPEYAAETTPAHMEDIRKYLSHERMMALGEIGLDYHYDSPSREEQKKWFDIQLSLAGELGVPVVLHIREAFGDGMDILRAHRGTLSGGIMHCFSGSYEVARECVDMGLHIAFGGALTFHNAIKQRDVAARLPLESLLLETDCPYMTPVPMRGKRNDPSLMLYTAGMLAEVRGISPERVAQATWDNANRVFLIHD